MAILPPIPRLPYLQDYESESWFEFERAANTCRQTFGRHGFTTIDTPIIELEELFLRKSGGELASKLFSFSDPAGNRVSLRAEFTAPIIRHLIDKNRLGVGEVKVSYSGPVFRYTAERDNGDSAFDGSFTQAGAEHIGESGAGVDGHLVAVAVEGITELGLDSPKVTLGHVRILESLLNPLNLSRSARHFLVNSVARLASGGKDEVRIDAERSGMVGGFGLPTEVTARKGINQSVDPALLIDILHEPLSEFTGSRTPQEIATGLANKMKDLTDPRDFDEAMDRLIIISSAGGGAEQAIDAGRTIINSYGNRSIETTAIDDLSKTVEEALSAGVAESSLEINFGLAREITYYTGMVFDLIRPSDGAIVGGGGRYDNLVSELGGPSGVSARGFAYNLDTILSETDKGSVPEPEAS